MCVPFLHYHIARPNTSTSTILRWHCLLQHRSSFWGQLHVWPKSEASSTCDPLAVLGFGVTLICCCFSVESSHDQKYQQRMDGGSSFLHWIWQVWMVSPIFGQKRWSMSTPEKISTNWICETEKHGKLETIWHRASPEAGGFCSNQKYEVALRCGKRWFSRRRLDSFGMVKTCEDHFGCFHLRLRTTIGFKGTLNSVMVKEPYSNTIIRKILQSNDYCMIHYDTVWS